MSTPLDLEKICSEVMTAKSPCLVGPSDNAGRYLTFISYLINTLLYLICLINLSKFNNETIIRAVCIVYIIACEQAHYWGFVRDLFQA